MDQCHAWWSGRASISATVPKKGRCEGAIASTSSPSGRSILAHRPGEIQRNGPPHLRRLGGDGRITNEQEVDEIGGSRRSVALYSGPGSGGSVTQPGETVGLNAGAPLPQGWYAINTVDWGCSPAAHMYGSHHSGCRLVNAVDDFGRESTVAGGVAWGGSRRATQPTLRSNHLL